MALSQCKLCDLVDAKHVLELENCSKDEAITLLCRQLARDSRILNEQALLQAMLYREQQMTTGIGLGIAIPHVKIPEVRDMVITIGRCAAGIDFNAIDKKPVSLIFMIAASDQQTREFVRVLAQVTHLLRHGGIRQALLRAAIPQDFLQIIRDHEC